MPIRELAGDVAMGWAVLTPLALITLAALIWGRVSLRGDEARLGILLSAAVSLGVMVPLVWAAFVYFATFNAQPPTARTVWMGGRAALLLLPLSSTVAAILAFKWVHDRARRRGAAARPLAVRLLAATWITAAFVVGGLALAFLCIAAAGPKAFGGS